MKILSGLLATALISLSASAAFADSCNKTALGDCLYNTGVTCRITVPACLSETAAGRSVPDATLAVTSRCCKIKGSKKKDKQTACFKTFEAGLSISARTAGPLKAFVTETRRAIGRARHAGCSTGSNT